MLQANGFHQGWGQVIFQSANEINQNYLIKQRTADMQSQLESEKAWWENKRAGIQSQFMKELEGSAEGVKENERPTSSAGQPAKKKTGSDDDAVIVEGGGPAQAQGGGGGGGKKKNKK